MENVPGLSRTWVQSSAPHTAKLLWLTMHLLRLGHQKLFFCNNYIWILLADVLLLPFPTPFTGTLNHYSTFQTAFINVMANLPVSDLLHVGHLGSSILPKMMQDDALWLNNVVIYLYQTPIFFIHSRVPRLIPDHSYWKQHSSKQTYRCLFHMLSPSGIDSGMKGDLLSDVVALPHYFA